MTDYEKLVELLNREDVYRGGDWVSLRSLKEIYKDDNDQVWSELSKACRQDIVDWHYNPEYRGEIENIERETGRMFSKAEIAMELGHLRVRTADLLKWFKERQNPETTATIDTSHPACSVWMRRTLEALQAMITGDLTGDKPDKLPSKKHISAWLKEKYAHRNPSAGFLDAASSLLNPARTKQ